MTNKNELDSLDLSAMESMRHDDEFKRTTPLWGEAQFKKFPVEFKVPAILSDGQWYEADKVRRLAGSQNLEEIQAVIDSLISEKKAVVGNNGISYRMTYDQLSQWRQDHAIPLYAQLIQALLYPRIVSIGDKHYTEPEVFLPVNRHPFGTVKFSVRDGVIDDLRNELYYIGHFVQDEEPNHWKVICLSADWAKEKLVDYEHSRGGEGRVFDHEGRPSAFNIGMMRDLNEFDHRLIKPIISFYQTFRTVGSNGESRPAILQPSAYRTLRLYTEDGGDGDAGVVSQLNLWIIDAIQHYNNDTGPFAVYLGFIANKRVNDLPGKVLGRRLATFQNRKARAIKNLHKKSAENDSEMFTDEQLRKEMVEEDERYALTQDEYIDLDSQLKTWQQTRHSTTLQWSETGEERQVSEFDMRHQLDSMDSSRERLASISRIQAAVVKAGLSVDSMKDTRLMLSLLSHSNGLGNALMSSLSSELSDDFKDALAESLSSF